MSTTTADIPAAHEDGHGHGNGHAHGHSPHLAHHFDTVEQQFSTSKLGMWTFLATEVLMFGGLFCAYAVYRFNHPEVYLWAHQALDAKWGMINTIVLLASSFTMAWGVRAAQTNQKGLLQLMLALTFLGGVCFMCIKGVEYQTKWKHNLFPGDLNAFNSGFNPGAGKNAAEIREHTVQIVEEEGREHRGETEAAAENALQTNAAGASGESARPINPAANEHPNIAAGANVIQPATSQPVSNGGEIIPIGHTSRDALAGTPDSALVQPPTFATGGVNPAALDQEGVATRHWTTYAEMEPTDRAQLTTFFSIYFMMTGLHGIHVLVGMGIMVWLFVKASNGSFSSEYFTPVDLGGLYWHLVDLIWIFLFPLLYLIH